MYKLLIVILLSGVIFAQPSSKVMERIQTVKKVKLLDVLDLNEKESEKLLIKYNTFEKKFISKLEEFDKIEEDLEDAIKDENSKNILEYSNQFEAIKNELFQISEDKDKAMKSILSVEKYAIYLIFEKRFKKELSRELMNRGRDRTRGRGRENRREQ